MNRPPHPTDDPVYLRRGIALGIVVLALALAAFVGSIMWIFRGGMGPDAIESTGMEAWNQFWNLFWPVVAICGLLCIVATAIWPWGRSTMRSKRQL